MITKLIKIEIYLTFTIYTMVYNKHLTEMIYVVCNFLVSYR